LRIIDLTGVYIFTVTKHDKFNCGISTIRL